MCVKTKQQQTRYMPCSYFFLVVLFKIFYQGQTNVHDKDNTKKNKLCYGSKVRGA